MEKTSQPLTSVPRKAGESKGGAERERQALGWSLQRKKPLPALPNPSQALRNCKGMDQRQRRRSQISQWSSRRNARLSKRRSLCSEPSLRLKSNPWEDLKTKTLVEVQ
jgi:hypothetical protein